MGVRRRSDDQRRRWVKVRSGNGVNEFWTVGTEPFCAGDMCHVSESDANLLHGPSPTSTFSTYTIAESEFGDDWVTAYKQALAEARRT